MKNIVIIEPACASNVHFPFNSGLVATIAFAYNLAEITFIGDADQCRKISESLPKDLIERCKFKPWEVYSDKDTGPTDIFLRLIRLLKVGRKEILDADLIVLAAASGTTLAALNLLVRPKNQLLQIFMHGNLNDLHGWRSRNPLKRWADLYSGFKRSIKKDAQLLVLEEHILSKAIIDFPWMAKSIKYFPHPQLDSELLQNGKNLNFPIKIGLAGISSPEKGFVEFCALASQLKEKYPKKFEFHVIGKRHESNDKNSFLNLDLRPAESQLEREEYLQKLDSMHFIFFWPTGDYYKNASSGIFYDGINRKIPFICNFTVKSFHADIDKMGLVASSISDLERKLLTLDVETYQGLIANLAKFSEGFSCESLAIRFRTLSVDI